MLSHFILDRFDYRLSIGMGKVVAFSRRANTKSVTPLAEPCYLRFSRSNISDKITTMRPIRSLFIA